jgi:Ca2+-binding RTX toxin-like protein
MRPMSMAVLVSALVLLGSLPAAAQAAPVLDQSQEDISGAAFAIGQLNGPQSLAQTFTAGLSGTLDEVDLYLQPAGGTDAITVEIRTVSANVPTNVVLATATIPAARVTGGFVTVAFAAPAAVHAGTAYAIVAYTPAPSLYGWRGTLTNSYAGGSLVVSGATPPTTWSVTNFDTAFRTRVNPLPLAVADAYGVVGGATLSVSAPGVLANDTADPDTDPLTAQLDSTTTRGTLAFNADGSFTYTPFEDTAGTDSFTYRARDGADVSPPATVTINVQAGCNGRRATQAGTAGNDELGGTGGNDVIVGLGGNDVIEAGSGTDLICGGSGRDSVRAGSGDDTVYGGSGDDTLDGGSGNDMLFGEAGVDRLLGGGDNDALDGGADTPDRCDGEGGTDTATASCETVFSVP